MPTFVARRAPHSPKLDSRKVCRVANAMLHHLHLLDAELSVLLTDDDCMRRLNREHRHKDRTTDVLSFHTNPEYLPPSAGARRILGDIVISLDTAARQAMRRRRQLAVEIRWLLAHGILHLLGFDHVRPRQKREMETYTRRLVRSAPLSISKSR